MLTQKEALEFVEAHLKTIEGRVKFQAGTKKGPPLVPGGIEIAICGCLLGEELAALVIAHPTNELHLDGAEFLTDSTNTAVKFLTVELVKRVSEKQLAKAKEN